MEPLRPLRAGSTPDDDWKSKALIFRGQRQALLASNIANADTPGYRAMDVSFADSLRQEMKAQEWSPTTAGTTAGDASRGGLPAQSTLAFARYIQPVQTNLDGNSVDMDRERAAFAQNAILYQFALTVVEDEWKEFKQASSDPRR